VRTWAPRGQTPLQYHFNWKLLSATAGITWRNFYFRLYRGTIRTAQVLDFLNHLLRHVPGKLLLIWDRPPQHRARLLREFVATQSDRLLTEYLPCYVPELNAVEYLWGHWKHHALSISAQTTLTELGYFRRFALRRMRRRSALVRSFWKQPNLSL
jgi:transposase